MHFSFGSEIIDSSIVSVFDEGIDSVNGSNSDFVSD